MRAIVYDKTCVRTRGHLSPIWATGARLFKALRRADEVYGVTSWDEALTWLGTRTEPIKEIQYWGHGKWGGAWIGDDFFDASALGTRRAQLAPVRERLAPGAQIWFRCCETFGARRGIDFAERLADFMGVRVAGHTFIIAFHQSGLHALEPGMRADWSPEEGVKKGTGEAPLEARWSRPWCPRTVTALHGEIPAAWITRRARRSG